MKRTALILAVIPLLAVFTVLNTIVHVSLLALGRWVGRDEPQP